MPVKYAITWKVDGASLNYIYTPVTLRLDVVVVAAAVP